MSDLVLFCLLNELSKRDKMRGSSLITLIRYKYNNFNNTIARILEFYLSHDIKITCTLKSHFSHETLRFMIMEAMLLWA